MAHWLKALTDLVEDPGLESGLSSQHPHGYTKLSINSSSMVSDVFFCPP